MVAQADDTVALAGDHNLGELQDGVIGSAKRRSSERASSLASLMSLSTTPRRSWISWGLFYGPSPAARSANLARSSASPRTKSSSVFRTEWRKWFFSPSLFRNSSLVYTEGLTLRPSCSSRDLRTTARSERWIRPITIRSTSLEERSRPEAIEP